MCGPSGVEPSFVKKKDGESKGRETKYWRQGRAILKATVGWVSWEGMERLSALSGGGGGGGWGGCQDNDKCRLAGRLFGRNRLNGPISGGRGPSEDQRGAQGTQRPFSKRAMGRGNRPSRA